MVLYYVVKGSMQARRFPADPATCVYSTDLVWVTDAWQLVTAGPTCGGDERWQRFASVPQLPSPGTLAAGTQMDDTNPGPAPNPTPSDYTGLIVFSALASIGYIIYNLIKSRK